MEIATKITMIFRTELPSVPTEAIKPAKLGDLAQQYNIKTGNLI